MSSSEGSRPSAASMAASKAPRVALMCSVHPGLSQDVVSKVFNEYRVNAYEDARLKDGLQGTIRLGLPSVDDPFVGTPWDTKRQKIDATIEITLHAAIADINDLVPLVADAGQILREAIVAEKSSLVAGIAHIRTPDNAPVVEPGKLSFLAPFGGHRDPSIDGPTFAEWWAEHHAPLALRAFDGYASSYEQLHVDERATRAAIANAGLGGPEYSIFESNRFSDVARLQAFFAQTELMQEAYEDEVGRIDHDAVAAFGWVELVQ